MLQARKGLGIAFIPMQFFSKRIKVTPALWMQESKTLLGRTHFNSIPFDETGERLHIEIDIGLQSAHKLNADLALKRQHDRPVGQGVRRNRRHHPAGDAGVNNRATHRHRVRGGARG